MPPPSPDIHLSADVRHALAHSLPIVALESTIIAHGLPYPTNLSVAHALESVVRDLGATPATVAVLHGVPHVGLTRPQLHHLSSTPVLKLSRRDLPLAYAQRHTGATTVSATMAISHRAGVRVFATGGVGGVHRGAADTGDVSADVSALATIPQLLVCAGVKAILDVRKTLELLETHSVPVLVLRADTFPAFYSRGTLPAPAVVQSEADAAAVLHMAARAAAPHAVMLAVPVPEADAADAARVDKAIEQALAEMARSRPQVLPKEVTPFLLRRVAELTDGESLRANVALAKNNAAAAARAAVALHALVAGDARAGPAPDVLVVGGVTLDIHCDAARGRAMVRGASNRGSIRQRAGGVAWNVAEAARRGGAAVRFVSAVGDDVAGRAVLEWVRGGVGADAVRVRAGRRTAACCVVHDESGDLAMGIADFDDVFRAEGGSLIAESRDSIGAALQTAKLACFDGNLSPSDMSELVEMCRERGVGCWYEPTSTQKSGRVVEAKVLSEVKYLSPNEVEMGRLGRAVGGPRGAGVESAAEDVLRLGGGGANGQAVLVTQGAKGVTRFRLKGGVLEKTRFKGVPVHRVENTTGAGDAFAGACIAALARGVGEDEAIQEGIRAAAESCRAGDGKEVRAKL